MTVTIGELVQHYIKNDERLNSLFVTEMINSECEIIFRSNRFVLAGYSVSTPDWCWVTSSVDVTNKFQGPYIYIYGNHPVLPTNKEFFNILTKQLLDAAKKQGDIYGKEYEEE